MATSIVFWRVKERVTEQKAQAQATSNNQQHMSQRVVCYAGGDESRIHKCFVNSKVVSAVIQGPLAAVLCGGHADLSVTLAVESSARVSESEIVVHRAVLDYLNLTHGCDSYVSFVPLASLAARAEQLPSAVHLQFLSFKTPRHWDVCEDLDEVMHSQYWSNNWPIGVQQSAILESLPMLLCGCAVAAGRDIVLPYLNGWLAARIVDTSPRAETLLIDDDIVITAEFLSVSQEAHVKRNDELSKAVIDSDIDNDFHFTESILSMISHCISTFSKGSVSLPLPHSFLLLGVTGCGKSSLMRQLLRRLSAMKAKDSFLKVHSISCENIDKDVIPKADSRELTAEGLSSVSVPTTDFDCVRLSFLSDIQVLFSILGNQQLSSFTSPHQVHEYLLTVRTILLLDDIDCVFDVFADVDDWSATYSSRSTGITSDRLSDWKALGYYLQRVLSYLTAQSHEYLLWIVAAARRPEHKLLRSSSGCPELERVLTVTKPSQEDRATLIRMRLKQLTIDAELEELAHASTADQCCGRQDALLTLWSDRIAQLTRGYLPVDLMSVLDRAAVMTAADTLPQLSEHPAIKSNWRWQTMLDALSSVPLKSLQTSEFAAQCLDEDSAAASWKDFAGYADTIRNVQRILKPLLVGSEYSAKPVNSLLKFKVPRGMVLHGPSGCGKTFLAKIIANELKMNFIRVQSTDLLSKYFGQTEEKIRNLFHVARSTAPSLLFFDDFDALAHKRSANDGHQGSSSHASLHNRVLSTFLNELDGIAVGAQQQLPTNQSVTESSVFVLAACRSVDSLDEALIRPGRLQYHVLLDYCTAEDIACCLRHCLRSMPVEEPIDYDTIQSVLENNSVCRATPAVIEGFCDEVRWEVLREVVELIESQAAVVEPPPADQVFIQQRHFDSVLRRMFLNEVDFQQALVESQ